jgi:glyceraldehyde-3-phosphate dehydrogenase/erythrose-4-phosphate dehydrogenase
VLAHLLRYDSILGPLDADVTMTADSIVVGSASVAALAERDPADRPWKDLGADVVVESTGFFTDAAKARARRRRRCEEGDHLRVHAYTADQNLQDNIHKDLRRARGRAKRRTDLGRRGEGHRPVDERCHLRDGLLGLAGLQLIGSYRICSGTSTAVVTG